MKTERELLKEAAEIMKSVKQVAGDVRFVNEIKNDLTVSIENIEAYLSQPYAVAMRWEEAQHIVATKYGFENFTKMLLHPDSGWEKVSESAHLFMESNRVQSSKENKPRTCLRCKKEPANNTTLCISCQMDDRPTP